MSEAETAFYLKLLYAAGGLFVIGYVGNLLSFSNRFVNALVTAIVFAIFLVALYFFTDSSGPTAGTITPAQWMNIGIAAAIVFGIDLVANLIAFNSRFVNALMTAIVFAVLFGGLMYATGGVPQSV